MNPVRTLGEYWDRYAAGERGAAGGEDDEALRGAFGWTQYPGHGPGAELLGEPATALELGCGDGAAVAALAAAGTTATGIDVSAVQCQRARDRWGRIPGSSFLQADVVDFLGHERARWEAIYSIWGAVWFTDPQVLLPLIRARLAPGGRLVFSHAPAVPDSYGPQGVYGAGFTGRQVWLYRWAYEPEDWALLLRMHGFAEVRVWVEQAPQPGLVGTLMATARG